MVSNVKRKTDREAGDSAEAVVPDSDVGRALRSVYEKAIGESVPQEMLDLLGKLK